MRFEIIWWIMRICCVTPFMKNMSIPLALLIIQKRILMFFILVLAIVVWIRQEWHILGKFEFTEAMQTKRQIIHFNGSNFVLFVNRFISRGIFSPSRESTFLDCTRDSVVQNQWNNTSHRHACWQQHSDDLVDLINTCDEEKRPLKSDLKGICVWDKNINCSWTQTQKYIDNCYVWANLLILNFIIPTTPIPVWIASIWSSM